MAPVGGQFDPCLLVLRSISHRIANARPSDLPHIVPTQIEGMHSCHGILSQPKGTASATNEAEIVVHKFLTQISTLVQGRHVQERWAAAVLIKAATQAGGFEVLTKSKGWITALLANLRKPDPPTVRGVYVATLTRLFIMTRPFPSIVREVTTPTLPQFIRTCLQNASKPQVDEEELRAVLAAFCKLITHHTTIFRSFSQELTGLLDPMAGSRESTGTSTSRRSYSIRTIRLSARLAALLHCIEPKQGSSSSWEKGLASILERCHASANTALAGTDEQLESALAVPKQGIIKQVGGLSDPQKLTILVQGFESLDRGLHSLVQYLASATSTSVSICIKDIDVLLQRLLSTITLFEANYQLPKFHSESSKEERDLVSTILPRLHVATMRVMSVLIVRAGTLIATLAPNWCERIRWLFSGEQRDLSIRTATYSVLTTLLRKSAGALSRETFEQLNQIIKTACDDADFTKLQKELIPANKQGQIKDLLRTTSAEDKAFNDRNSELHDTAVNLLTTVLVQSGPGLLSESSRTKIERTAIMTQHRELLSATVLYPGVRRDGRPGRSLLPFLVQCEVDGVTEAIMRPRVPVLHDGKIQSDAPPLREDGTISEIVNDLNGLGSSQGKPPSGYTPQQSCAASLAVQPDSMPPHAAPAEVQSQPGEAMDMSSTTGSKRGLEESEPMAGSVDKRVRVGVTHTLDQGAKALAEDLEMPEAASSVPVETESTSFATTAPVAITTAPPARSYAPPSNAEEESDDEDFVIPELTTEVSDEEE